MRYFIDTNIIIDYLKQKPDAIEKLKPLFLDNRSEIYINRLVVMETLRNIKFTNKNEFNNAKSAIELFRQVDIKPEIYNEAIEFSRYCRSKGVTLSGKCEAIDFLHFITAKHYNLEIITNDKAFIILEEKYTEFNNL